MKALLIVNHRSGRGKALAIAQRAAGLLGNGQSAIVSLDEHIPDEVLEQSEYLVAVGGDGTVQYAARQAHRLGKTLAILPAGTGNALSKALNITFDGAIQALINRQPPQRLDLLQVNGQIAIFCAGGGLDSRVLESLDQQLVRKVGRLAYVSAVRNALKSFEPPEVEVILDGEIVYEGRSWLVMVSNVARLGAHIGIEGHSGSDDGYLRVNIMDNRRPGFVNCLGKLARSSYLRKPIHVNHCIQGRHAEVRFSPAERVQIDGELSERPEPALVVRVLPQALSMLY